MQAPVVIREVHALSQISAGDLVAINRLLEQLSPGTTHRFSQDDLSVLLIKGSELLVARDMAKGGTLVGITVLAKVAKVMPWHAEIHDVVLDKPYRGQGLGKSLLLRAIELAEDDRRLSYIELTSKPSRVAANALYVSLGFELISIPNPALGDRGTNLYRLRLER